VLKSAFGHVDAGVDHVVDDGASVRR